MDNFPGIVDYLGCFQDRLKSADLFPVNDDATQWEGSLHIEWSMPESGGWGSADHKISVILPSGFPYRAPIVLSLDVPKIERSLHLTSLGSLCLWREPGGWEPFTSGQKFLDRVYQWFINYHQGNWSEDFAPTDLHLYLPIDGLIVLGDEWVPSKEKQAGSFVLWRNKKNNYQPNLVGLKSDRYQKTNREKRLVDALIWSEENITGYSGVWFRVQEPFVPGAYLEILLDQIDHACGCHSGDTLSLFLNYLAQLDTTKDIPIAIGYPGANNQDYWLFLNAKKPIASKLRLTDSIQRKRIEIHSFSVAPARKSDIIRRTLHTSKKLVNKKIILFGVGSLGSSIALLLAKAGIDKLCLVDSDYVHPANAIRHEVGINWTGFKKTAAIQAKIRFHNPDCSVITFDEQWEKEEILKIVKDADMVVDATANGAFSLWLNQIVVENSLPILFVTTYRRALIGRMIFNRQDERYKDPCLACYYLSESAWPESKFPLIPPDTSTIFGEEGCASVTEEADAISVEASACLAAKIIVDYFSGNTTANLLLLVNNPLPEGPELFLLEGIHKLTNESVENCPICGHTQKA